MCVIPFIPLVHRGRKKNTIPTPLTSHVVHVSNTSWPSVAARSFKKQILEPWRVIEHVFLRCAVLRPGLDDNVLWNVWSSQSQLSPLFFMFVFLVGHFLVCRTSRKTLSSASTTILTVVSVEPFPFLVMLPWHVRQVLTKLLKSRRSESTNV